MPGDGMSEQSPEACTCGGDGTVHHHKCPAAKAARREFMREHRGTYEALASGTQPPAEPPACSCVIGKTAGTHSLGCPFATWVKKYHDGCWPPSPEPTPVPSGDDAPGFPCHCGRPGCGRDNRQSMLEQQVRGMSKVLRKLRDTGGIAFTEDERRSISNAIALFGDARHD